MNKYEWYSKAERFLKKMGYDPSNLNADAQNILESSFISGESPREGAEQA